MERRGTHPSLGEVSPRGPSDSRAIARFARCRPSMQSASRHLQTALRHWSRQTASRHWSRRHGPGICSAFPKSARAMLLPHAVHPGPGKQRKGRGPRMTSHGRLTRRVSVCPSRALSPPPTGEPRPRLWDIQTALYDCVPVVPCCSSHSLTGSTSDSLNTSERAAG